MGERTSTEFLPFARPDIGQAEIDAVTECLRSGWLTTGEKARQFEERFAEYLGVDHALAVSSCTAGLHLSLEALGIAPGDRVLTTPFTFTATAETIRYLGADPLFVDIDPRTLNMDATAAERVLTDTADVKALLPVHFAGLACEMDSLSSLAEAHGLSVLEDAAHALPCTWRGRPAGTLGDVGAFSFYATKTLATGEGGMVVTDDDELADRVRVMRLHGIDRDAFDRYRSERPGWYYEVVAAGYKYNMPDTAAALGIEQLRRVGEMQRRRQKIAEYYSHEFADLPLECPAAPPDGDLHAWHLYVVRLAEETVQRDEFIRRMADGGIGTSVHFIPLHLHPYWRDRYGFEPLDFPVAYDVYRRCVSLPIYSRMTNADVERTAESVRNILVS